MASPLHFMSPMTRFRPIDHSARHVPQLFIRRPGGWNGQRVGVMALPLVPTLLFVGLLLMMEKEAPLGSVPIQSAFYCCSPRETVTPRDGSEGASPLRNFRTVYTRQESRAIDVARFLETLHPRLPQAERRRLSSLLVRLGEHYGYDPVLIVAVIMTESSFNPSSRSHMGALGLMQILPRTGQSLAVETERPWSGDHVLFDPYLNISLGVRYLAKLQKRFGAMETALVAYNYGPGRVEEMLKRGDPLPTEYTRRVLTRYHQFRLLERSLRL